MSKGKLIASGRTSLVEGKPTPEQERAWVRQQIPYKNYAGHSERLDTKVVQFVAARRDAFRSRMAGPMRRWAVNCAVANTEAMWLEREDDVHIPEPKKALDSKVARIEEAVTSFDPVFEVVGTRGEMSRHRAKVLGNYIYRRMEMASWKDLVQPCARDGELCNIMAVKVDWEVRSELAVDRQDELKFPKNGDPYWDWKRYMRKQVVRRGPRLTQVDPFWFIYDLEAKCADECAYIGDESQPFLHDIQADADRGIYSKKNVEKLADELLSGSTSKQFVTNSIGDGTSTTGLADQWRRSRSIALGSDYGGNERAENGAQRVRMIEMWALFDFGDGEEGVVDPRGMKITGVQRVVITMANSIVIRFQLNPFDRKFVPYAFTMVNRSGHELVAPAPFDAVVQMSAHYDRVASNIMRWWDLSVSPFFFSSDGANSDLPETLQDIEPGTVIKNAGNNWDFFKAPDLGNSIGYIHSYFRREIEETSGALRVFESPQGTATETERKVQEQQRVVRSSIRAAANLWRQVAMLVKSFEAQFSTGVERFEVAGKDSKILGQWASVTPDMLHEEVDIRVLAITDLHTLGNQVQQLSQFMTRWGPLLPNMPFVDMEALCRLDFELTVGRTMIDRVFPKQTQLGELWSQEEENEMLLAGQDVETHESDDDAEHLQSLQTLLQRKDLPDYVREKLMVHASAHLTQMRTKEMEDKQRMQKAQQEQQLMATRGGVPGVDKPPVEGGMPANRTPDVTPGPPQSRTQPRTGREGSGQSQTQVMQ